MLPIKDLNPTSTPAVVVPILIALNAAAFLFWQPTFAGGSPEERALRQARFTACHAVIPYEVTNGETVAEGFGEGRTGSDNRDLVIALQRGNEITGPGCEDKNVWLPVLVSMFLHGSWLHIISNMLFLWVFGNNVEDRLGRARFTLFYLACGILATIAQTATNVASTVPMVGASGAIAGVLGAYLLLFPRARIINLVFFFVIITTIELPAIVVLGIWFVLQLTPLLREAGTVTGEVGGVAYMAHVGGFVAGLVLVLPFRRRGRASPRPQFYD